MPELSSKTHGQERVGAKRNLNLAMYPIAIIGDNLAAHVMTLAARVSGFESIHRFAAQAHYSANDEDSATICLGANASRVLTALGALPPETMAFYPDREQVRLGRSAYLLTELPLGEFYRQRYGAGLVNYPRAEVLEYLAAQTNTIAPINKQAKSAEELENTHQLVIQSTGARYSTAEGAEWPRYAHYRARLREHPLKRANVTWLGKGQFIEQRSDHAHVQFDVFSQSAYDLDPTQWHDSLVSIFSHLEFIGHTDLAGTTPNAQLYLGRTALIGQAHSPYHPAYPEAQYGGIEDAWVLSRMMENYEEDISDGLQAYERYRRPRARKLWQAKHQRLVHYTQPKQLGRLRNNIVEGLRARFLPELAMQQRDWIHQHDVIKGFR